MSILENRATPESEKFLQNKVINDSNVQRYIIDNLGLEYHSDIRFIKGKPHLNRIYPEIFNSLCLFSSTRKNNEILSLVECKGANINVTDYAFVELRSIISI